MNPIVKFQEEVKQNIDGLAADAAVQGLSNVWLREITRYKYAYNFTWLGRPIIQLPQDLVALQEIIWTTKPDVIIETGIAHGGSLIFHASMLQLIDSPGFVLGIDVDIRPHNRQEIEAHPFFKRIRLVEGSSTDSACIAQVRQLVEPFQRVMVVLDSNHTHEHVLAELKAYSSFLCPGQYLVVLDTIIEDMPQDFFPDRPWGRGNNPKTAVWEFLKESGRFEIDREIHSKLLLTVAPDGYLRCIA